MSTQRYSVIPHPIETILTWVKSGEIAIPETQRSFDWDATKGRKRRDSLYQATGVINKALNAGLIRVADPDHPRVGYVPHWA